jgi:hypothetical protein
MSNCGCNFQVVRGTVNCLVINYAILALASTFMFEKQHLGEIMMILTEGEESNPALRSSPYLEISR